MAKRNLEYGQSMRIAYVSQLQKGRAARPVPFIFCFLFLNYFVGRGRYQFFSFWLRKLYSVMSITPLRAATRLAR